MATSFTSIKMPRVLGHYLLCNSSSTARRGPTSIMVHALLVSRAQIATFTEQPLNWERRYKVSILILLFST